MPRSTVLLLLLIVCSPRIAAAVQHEGRVDRAPPQDLKRLSIEELASLDVTSVSRRSERLSATAAAVSVVRQEDIHRSGAVILAEAMRLGDAIDVARVNGGTWGITTRGFNISTANKLLVLVDGRSTYSSLFGGTFWDVQDVLLADLDRIEVIRGPGAAIWGTNAVNGVVNIISRPVSDTQGTIVTLVGGDNERAIVSARHGGRAGRGHYRVYGKYRMREPQAFAGGNSAEDEVRFGQGGFQFDSDQTARTRWTLSAAAYAGTNGFADRPDGDVSGGHLLGRWARRTSNAGELALQAYYDRSYRRVPLQFEETRNAWEIDVQQRLARGRHTLVVGGTARTYRSDDLGIAGFRFEPPVRDGWNVAAFAQDEYELRPQRAYVIVGAKIGRNNFTGLELQPSARVRLHPSPRQMAWAAVSRAVRLPTRFDQDIRLVIPSSGAVILAGSSDFDAESVVAVEGGYRILPHPRVSLDAAVFANRYDDLRSQERRLPPDPPVVLDNQLNARTSGVELAGKVQIAANWRIHGSYVWLHKTLSFDRGSTDLTRGIFEANDPSHLASGRSYLDLPYGLAFDAVLRYAGRRPAPVVPAYAELDLRLGWTVRPAWELSLVGQNLLHARHQELASPGAPTFSFRRSVFARSIWRF
ncbi:MAG TPA: TonB-dependent receptor [Vicinamibacterales bacterium]|nr:TonB-dependent receptor [Vicinamibacterales bacterium]